MLNALTIDIEDYFQVHALSGVIRYEDWDKFECRIERNVDRLLEILNDLSPASVLSPQNLDFSLCPMPSAPCKLPKATFFILGWIAERYPALVRRIQNEGHEIACHGYSHKLIYHQSKEEFRDDVKKAKAILEDITGSEVIGYRAPSYSITNRSRWVFEVLIEEGFRYDSSIFPIRHDFYGFPDAPRFPFVICLNGNFNLEFLMLNFGLDSQNSKLKTENSKLKTQNSNLQHSNTAAPGFLNNSLTHSLPNSVIPPVAIAPQHGNTLGTLMEFPASTVRLLGQNIPISGGGYFRLFPYCITRNGLRRINEREREPFIFYMHPWEIDPDQPRIGGLSFRRRFRHYVNLGKTEIKFRKLLKDFQFSTVRNVMEHHGSTPALYSSIAQLAQCPKNWTNIKKSGKYSIYDQI